MDCWYGMMCLGRTPEPSMIDAEQLQKFKDILLAEGNRVGATAQGQDLLRRIQALEKVVLANAAAKSAAEATVQVSGEAVEPSVTGGAKSSGEAVETAEKVVVEEKRQLIEKGVQVNTGELARGTNPGAGNEGCANGRKAPPLKIATDRMPDAQACSSCSSARSTVDTALLRLGLAENATELEVNLSPRSVLTEFEEEDEAVPRLTSAEVSHEALGGMARAAASFGRIPDSVEGKLHFAKSPGGVAHSEHTPAKEAPQEDA